MKSKLIAGLLIATSAALAAPAFASGLGPAPFYRPVIADSSSRADVPVQAAAVEQRAAGSSDVGGTAVTVQSGGVHSSIARGQSSIDDLYRGR
ncbi:hypothetical protein GWC77_21795 [Paraburkholderia sp. NMBU_R16]|uniref:hypothetical protein n=1 Tax=Paraburkholderia sp. NMBU_R16 TaxID=2698676 RepID=UPI001565A06C|nr:hypothetical protein [Paraburkholderia sp. NMBU_R16]NRO98561.1 hypothetical protein [Paraburkholderia sp. NMBU_R16]